MMDSWFVDAAKPADGGDIARLFRAVPPAPLQGLTIWGSPLFPRYFEDMLGRPAEPGAPRFFVLRGARRVGGCISLRSVSGELVLDNLCVEPDLRARFCGVQLMAEAIEAMRAETRLDAIVSDVFAGRTALAKFHQSIGGIEQTPRGWWAGPLASPTQSVHGTVQGLIDAEFQHSRWGFSSFTVRTSVAEYKVGRLPGPYFRLTDPLAADDKQLIRTLQSLDPSRNLLLIGPTETPASGWEQVALLRRFRTPLETMLRGLRQYLAPAEEVSAYASANLGN
jgi:hypothetical protein